MRNGDPLSITDACPNFHYKAMSTTLTALLFFKDSVSFCNSSWSWTGDPPSSFAQVLCWYCCGTISGSCCFLIEEMNFDFYHKDSCVMGRCNSCVWGSGWGEARQHLLSLCNPEHLVNKQLPRGKEEQQNSYASKQCGRVQPNSNCYNCGSYHSHYFWPPHNNPDESLRLILCQNLSWQGYSSWWQKYY